MNNNARRIEYKYDLMHHATPEFATATIEWDLSRMGAITRNRVVKWLKGEPPRMGGKARQVYEEVRRRFGIGEVVVDKERISYQSIPDYVLKELTALKEVQDVINRLEGRYTYPYPLTAQGGHFWIDAHLDTSKVQAAVDRMNAELADKRNEAVQFVEQGNKLSFVY